MALNITNFTENVNNVQALDDRPNASGMSSETLKATFDKAGSDIKTYINGTLIPELETAIDGTNSEVDDMSESLDKGLNAFDDTAGSTPIEMLRAKMDYCINNTDPNKTNQMFFINGGWNGVNYGNGIFSKIDSTYQLTWISSDVVYYYRKAGSAETFRYNNLYDTSVSVRDGLKIKTGTSLPGTVEDGCLFFLYS